jgi:hypothetical protein
MPHPDEGQIQAWLDGELEPEAGFGVRHHVEACVDCATLAEALRGQSQGFSRAMVVLDDEALNLADPGPLPVAAALSPVPRHPVRATGWSLARAAGLVLVAAGAAAALVPGSPVREWLEGLAMADAGVEAPIPARVEGAAETAPALVPAAGISVTPVAGAVAVRLQGFGESSIVHVRLTDAPRASVRVERVVEAPRFVTGPGVLEVIGQAEGEIWVELPRSARDAVVEVDGEEAVRLEGGRLVLEWPPMDSLREDVKFRIGG